MYKRAIWKDCSYFLPSDTEFRTIGSKTIITGYSILDKKSHYVLSNVPELVSFSNEEKLTFLYGDIKLEYEGASEEFYFQDCEKFTTFMNKVQMYVKNYWNEVAIENLDEETETAQETL
jgi:hypothetical protein